MEATHFAIKLPMHITETISAAAAAIKMIIRGQVIVGNVYLLSNVQEKKPFENCEFTQK